MDRDTKQKARHFRANQGCPEGLVCGRSVVASGGERREGGQPGECWASPVLLLISSHCVAALLGSGALNPAPGPAHPQCWWPGAPPWAALPRQTTGASDQRSLTRRLGGSARQRPTLP